jgi:type VI secretion system secreted protein VgrG
MVQHLSQENRQARIDTPLGEDVLLLQSFSGVEALSRDFRYSATVLSEDGAIDGSAIVGKRVSFTYFDEDGRERHFNGFVNRFEYSRQVEEPAQLAAYILEVVPWLWFLKHNVDCQIFQDETAPNIIKQVFQELGFNEFRQELNENYASREYCVQYRETDFNFVSRLMEEEGIFYYFEHTKDKHTLVMCDSPAGYFDLDETEVQYTSVGQANAKHLTGWRHIYEFRPGKIAQKDFNFKTPVDGLVTDKKSRVNFEGSSNLEVYQYPGLYDEASKGDRLTKVRLQELESEHDHVVGSGTYLNFTPGGKFEVDKHSRPGESGKSYAIIEVFTEFRSNLGFDNHSGEDFRNEFRCIPSETIFRPNRISRKPIVEGPQTAIVTTDGQEIVVDEHARVKVQFHWDRYGKKDVNSSCWIRVSQHHAGGNWGMIDIPRQHEEVIVGFLDGDPDRPIITGRVYNGHNRTPFELKGAGNNAKHKTRRGNITKSYEADGYNELSMDDTAGKEQLRVHAQHDMDVAVLNDSRTRIFANKHQIVGWEKDGQKGGDQLEQVWQDKHANIKRDQIEHIEGNQQIMIGNGDADGGSLDVVIEKQELKKVGEGGVHLIVDGPANTAIGGNESTDTSGNYMHKAGGNIGMQAGSSNEIHLKAGMKIVIEAGMGQVSINGPGGFICIDQTGVTIQGTTVKINSGGAKGSGGGCSPEAPETAAEATPTEPAVADRFRT